MRNLCRTQGHTDFSLMFTSRSFIILFFTFKSLIHVDTFAHGVLWIIFCIRISICPSTIIWKDCYFSRDFSIHHFLKSVVYIDMSQFLDCTLSHWAICLSWSQYHTVFIMVGSLCFQMNFQISFSISTRKACWDFDWYYTEYMD